MKQKKISYEEAYKKLQELLARIENNQLDVDELSDTLKEASALLALCKEKLFVASEETKKILEEIN